MRDCPTSMCASRPLVVTQGDPLGVGPELIVRAAADGRFSADDRIVGDPAVLRALASRLSERFDDGFESRALEVIDALVDDPGGGGSELGQYAALCRGVDLVLADRRRALVTAPIDKHRAAAEGLRHPGHTEYLAARAGTRDYAMLMAGSKIRVVLATIHLPLAEVPRRLDREAIVRAGRLLADALQRDFGIVRPRVAVLGLNPHAGERGMLGDEERTIIEPAMEQLAESLGDAVELTGPLPADTAFHRHVEGEFDGVVAMYHDQGLGPFKLLHFSDGINMTLGLPFVRTSPDHGTAMDIAGTGQADPRSFESAIEIARGGTR